MKFNLQEVIAEQEAQAEAGATTHAMPSSKATAREAVTAASLMKEALEEAREAGLVTMAQVRFKTTERDRISEPLFRFLNILKTLCFRGLRLRYFHIVLQLLPKLSTRLL